MAFLAPLAAAGAGTAATVGFAAPALAKMGTLAATTGAGTALGTGLAAGSALGAGVGLKATGALLAPTLGTSLGTGLGSSMLTGGLGATGTGLGGVGLTGLGSAGLKAGAGLKGAGSLLAPTAGGALYPAGLASLQAPAGSLLKTAASAAGTSPASWSAINQAAGMGLGDIGYKAAALKPSFIKTADVATKAAFDPTRGLLGSAPKVSASPAMSPTPGLVENIRGVNTAMQGPANMSYASGARGLSPTAAALPPSSVVQPGANFATNLGNLIQNPSMDAAMDYVKEHPYATTAGALGIAQLMKPKTRAPEIDKGMIRPYEFTRMQRPEAYAVSPETDTSERLYFNDTFTPLTPYPAGSEESKKAAGGILGYAVGGPVEQMAAINAVGANTGYPMAGVNTPMYSNPMMQRPEAVNVISGSGDAGVGAYSGEPRFAEGGISNLGDYSDGGRLLRGPGNGTSDSIPAIIGNRQPARLADGEFVIPARIVSELGNGSTDAGAKQLYAMRQAFRANTAT